MASYSSHLFLVCKISPSVDSDTENNNKQLIDSLDSDLDEVEDQSIMNAMFSQLSCNLQQGTVPSQPVMQNRFFSAWCNHPYYEHYDHNSNEGLGDWIEWTVQRWDSCRTTSDSTTGYVTTV